MIESLFSVMIYPQYAQSGGENFSLPCIFPQGEYNRVNKEVSCHPDTRRLSYESEDKFDHAVRLL